MTEATQCLEATPPTRGGNNGPSQDRGRDVRGGQGAASGIEAFVGVVQNQQCDSVWICDQVQNFFPSSIWEEAFTWLTAESESPHEWFEFQTLVGYLAAKFPDLRLGIGIRSATRHRPVAVEKAVDSRLVSPT